MSIRLQQNRTHVAMRLCEVIMTQIYRVIIVYVGYPWSFPTRQLASILLIGEFKSHL